MVSFYRSFPVVKKVTLLRLDPGIYGLKAITLPTQPHTLLCESVELHFIIGPKADGQTDRLTDTLTLAQ